MIYTASSILALLAMLASSIALCLPAHGMAERRKPNWFAIVLIVAGMLLCASIATAAPPASAKPYRAMLIKSARFYWGISAPVATFGAQIQQESAWHPRAKSPFAEGLAQFTPQTAAWISGAYKLGSDDPYDPAWALRALTAYDRDLWLKLAAATPCDHMAFTLSAYNGGLGWVYRDQRIAHAHGQDPSRWWHSVAYYSHRGAAAFKENRGYPRRILFLYQPIYLPWGNGIDCTGVKP